MISLLSHFPFIRNSIETEFIFCLLHSLISFGTMKIKENNRFLCVPSESMLLEQESCQMLLICKRCTKNSIWKCLLFHIFGERRETERERERETKTVRQVIYMATKNACHDGKSTKQQQRTDRKRATKRIYWNSKCKTTNNFFCSMQMMMAKMLKIITSTFIVNYNCRYGCM